MNCNLKDIYKIEVVLSVLLFFSAILLHTFRLFENMPNIFLVCLGIMSFSNAYKYKEILEEDILSAPSLYLIATTAVVCMGYVVCLSFLLGRYFIRCL